MERRGRRSLPTPRLSVLTAIAVCIFRTSHLCQQRSPKIPSHRNNEVIIVHGTVICRGNALPVVACPVFHPRMSFAVAECKSCNISGWDAVHSKQGYEDMREVLTHSSPHCKGFCGSCCSCGNALFVLDKVRKDITEKFSFFRSLTLALPCGI